jgi:hypothetical protein
MTLISICLECRQCQGWMPLRSISVHPPMQKAWAFRSLKPVATQIWLHLLSQLDLVKASQLLSAVSNTKRGASRGTSALADLWCLKVVTGVVGSLMLVMVILAPLEPVVLDQGILKLAWRTPRAVEPYSIWAEFVMWRDGSNRLQVGTHSHTFQWNCSIPYGPPNLTMAQSTRTTQCRPKGWLYLFCMARLKHVLYLYHMGWLRLYCTCITWIGQGHIVAVPYGSAEVTVALTLYITCLFGNYFRNA